MESMLHVREEKESEGDMNWVGEVAMKKGPSEVRSGYFLAIHYLDY